MQTNSNSNHYVEMSWSSDDRPPVSNLQITDTNQCKNPLCTRLSKLGSDYCGRHGPTFTPDRQKWLDDIHQPSDSGPSRRELQRQLDRIEGKLDALLNGREYEDD